MLDFGLDVLFKGKNMARLLGGLGVALKISAVSVIISLPLGIQMCIRDRGSAVHGLQEGHRDQNRPGNLHQKSTVLRRKYGAFLFIQTQKKGGSFPQKGKSPPLLIIG